MPSSEEAIGGLGATRAATEGNMMGHLAFTGPSAPTRHGHLREEGVNER